MKPLLLSLVFTLMLLSSVTLSSAQNHGDKQHRDEVPARRMTKTVFKPKVSKEDKYFWNTTAQQELNKVLATEINNKVAKNVILFLGDGMGNPTIVAARIYKGQQKNISGEEESLVFENFPNTALSKTYCVDKQVADSASTGTAYLTGVKTNYKLIGVDASVKVGQCETVTEESKVYSIAKWALDNEKRAGIVTSTRITHATPAATYAHVAHRDYECDGEITEEMTQKCPSFKDIARQLVEDEPGRSFNVIMGGGYQDLVYNATDRPGDNVDLEECMRKDGRDLFQQWQDDRKNESKNYAAVRTKSELMNLDLEGVDHLMGIFGNSHIPWEFEKREKKLDLPTLAEMTEQAIKVLSQSEEGFFLLVEGGRIDHAHHDGTARKALDETIAFDEAIQKALDNVDIEETLIVVTADHSHTMTINGYPERGADILDIAGLGDDGLPYTTLMYTNGNGFNYTAYNETHGGRWDISGVNVTDWEYLQLSGVPRDSETHGGEDVGIYAIGPMSHLFKGVHQQNYIAHAMGYAACIGPNKDHCNNSNSVTGSLGIIILITVMHWLRNELL